MNKLWTNDSLFPRKFLLIPSYAVDDGCMDTISLSSGCTSMFSRRSKSAHDPRPQPFDRHLSEGAEVGVDDVRVEVEPDDLCNINDYFSKMDSKIRVVKENVSKLENRSRFVLELTVLLKVIFIASFYFCITLSCNLLTINRMLFLLLSRPLLYSITARWAFEA